MDIVAITIKTVEKIGVLSNITNILYEKGYNIVYTHLFLESSSGRIYMELEGVGDVESLTENLLTIDDVISVDYHKTLQDIYGKRVIVMGDGELMAKALQGGVLEAEKHNANGESISVDGMILSGGSEIQEAIDNLTNLPRVNALVLSGTMMGGKITEGIQNLKKEYDDLVIVSLDMLGDVNSVSDVVINDPIQAGAMAVKMISNRDSYNDALLYDEFLTKE